KKSNAAKALAFLSFSFCLWSLELFLLSYIKDVSTLDFWFHVTRVGMFFIPASIALFVLYMANPIRKKLFILFVVFPGFALSILTSVLNLFFFPSELKPVDSGYLPNVDAIFLLFAGNFFLCSLSSVLLVAYKYFSSAKQEEKIRLQWAIYLFIYVFFMGISSLYLMKYDFYLEKISGSITNVVFVVSLLYATVQHRLIEIDFLISQTLAKITAIALLFWFFFLLLSWYTSLGIYNNDDVLYLQMLYAIFALEIYPYILKKIMLIPQRFLPKDYYHYPQVIKNVDHHFKSAFNAADSLNILKNLFGNIIQAKTFSVFLAKSEDVKEDAIFRCWHTDLDEIPHSILSMDCDLVVGLKQQQQVLYTDESPEPMKSILVTMCADACLPIFYQQQLLALIFVGPSVNTKGRYTYDDTRLFEWLSRNLGNMLHRLNAYDALLDELGNAEKTLSMVDLFNQYNHDIKAPIGSIHTLVSNQLCTQEMREELILEETQKVLHSVETMCNILHGQHQRRQELLDINNIINRTLGSFRVVLGKITTDLAETPKMIGCPEDLPVLFTNLFKNAAEAKADDRPLTLHVSSWHDQGQGTIGIRVADNGKGMPPEILYNLWSHVKSSKRQSGGTGLGARVIKRIVDEHKGTINVSSVLNEGTVFTLHFLVGNGRGGIGVTRPGETGAIEIDRGGQAMNVNAVVGRRPETME
ncbi:MAG: ATP-binding protein, partial [Pseudomonadales bacterium]